MPLTFTQKLQALFLTDEIGSDDTFRARERLHQTWWRSFVLALPPGPHPTRPDEDCCSTISPREPGSLMHEAAVAAFEATLAARRAGGGAGLIDERRVRSNLLSSQPMAFNVFGHLWADRDLAAAFVRTFDPSCREVLAVEFEYVPEGGSIGDNSAFDLALIYSDGSARTLLGLECKYTDDFTAKDKRGIYYGAAESRHHGAYQAVFQAAKGVFLRPYAEYVESAALNQLFRNTLLAEKALQGGLFERVSTGLVCHPDHPGAMRAGAEMGAALGRPFHLLTLDEVVWRLQTLATTRALRDTLHLVWARYLGSALSASPLYVPDTAPQIRLGAAAVKALTS